VALRLDAFHSDRQRGGPAALTGQHDAVAAPAVMPLFFARPPFPADLERSPP
jgi:hypothetical protein